VTPYQFEVVTDAGERLAWRGSISVDPVKSAGEILVENLDLARLSPYYHTLITGELRSAKLDLAGRYEFSLFGAKPRLTVTDFALALRDVRVGKPGEATDVLSLKRLGLSGVAADSGTLAVDIAQTAVEGLRLKVRHDASGLDLIPLFTPRTRDAGRTTKLAVAANASALPRIRLAELTVSDAQLEAVDVTPVRQVEQRIESLSLTLRDLDSGNLAQPLPLQLALMLPAQGQITLGGTITAKPLGLDLAVKVEPLPGALYQYASDQRHPARRGPSDPPRRRTGLHRQCRRRPV
jgi:Domain of Unknown Function (DUF748)